MDNMHKYSGFTIIELMIVIVVIAILAAITIVSFNGIKDRAIVASLKSDLDNTAQLMELAKIDNSDNYPAAFPSGVKPSNGNVLQLTAVADSTKSFCINAYGPNNNVASISTGNSPKKYLCDGATVGTAVGGTVPTAPRGTNLLPNGFSAWTVSGGISYNSTTSEMVCNNSTYGLALSPLIRVDGATSGTFSYNGMATVASPTRAYSGPLAGSFYYTSDGVTAAYNTASSPGPYSGNGDAPPFAAPLASWNPVNFVMTLGPSIIYLRLNVQCDVSSTYYTSDTHYKDPTFIIQ